MGLLESVINVPQELRVWQLSGIRYLYLDGSATVPENATPKASSPAPEPTDPASWPTPWPTFWSKAPARPDLVLTYLDLGLDLLGQGDRRRSLLWRNLIQDLGWSGQNRIAFWPMAVPEDGRPMVNSAIFLQGIQLLAPRCVAFFGTDAVAPFLLSGTEPPQQLLGIPCVILPDPGALLHGEKEDWDAVLARLGTL